MTEVEKVISDLELVKSNIEWDNPLDYQIMIANAIQTIRELQELNKGLSETNTSNPMYEMGYKQGATDMEKAKQIIIDALNREIDRLQEQIPKWHLVAENDLPNELEDVLVIYEANIDGGTCDGEIIKSYGIGYLSNSKTNNWIFATYKSLKENPSVIAWMELPKFEEVE